MNQLVNITFDRLIEDLNIDNYNEFLMALEQKLRIHFRNELASTTDRKYIVKWQTQVLHPPYSSSFSWKDCYAYRKSLYVDGLGLSTYTLRPHLSTTSDRDRAELMTKEEAEQYVRDLTKITYGKDAEIEEY